MTAPSEQREPRRARTVAELDAIMDRFSSPECEADAARFVARPTDVVITPASKCGTTYLQQIAHGIRTGGSMDFEEISCVVPWFDQAYDIGIDIHGDQATSPRLFKSHGHAGAVPEGARYIVAFRDPVTRLVSLYRFLADWFFDSEHLDLEAFADYTLPPPGELGSYWQHLVSWWDRRDEPDVLLCSFETITTDTPGTVDLVAGFLGIELDSATRATVIEQASRASMLANVRQFDDHPFAERLIERGVLPPGGDTGKVTAGTRSVEVPAAVRERYAEVWHGQIEARYGFPDHAAFRAAVDARLTAR